MVDVQTIFEVFLYICLFHRLTFFRKKQNIRSWGYPLQVPDYQNFWIVRCQIKRILVYLIQTYF